MPPLHLPGTPACRGCRPTGPKAGAPLSPKAGAPLGRNAGHLRAARGLLLAAALAGVGNEALAEGILAVLQRSQAQRLAAYAPSAADSPEAQVIQRSLAQLLAATGPLPGPVDLRVVRGLVVAETLQGRVIVAHESLAHLPEAERQFALAHELGHIALGHWAEVGALYQQFIPGEVRPDTTDPVAPQLGRAASVQAHQQEYAADAFAWEAVQRLGHPPDTVHRFFMRMGVVHDTATHPGTGKRVAQLRGRMDGTQAP